VKIKYFNLTDRDLNINFGPLGDLIDFFDYQGAKYDKDN